MEYLMFVCTDPDAEPYDPAEDRIDEWFADAAGAHVRGDRLRPPADTKTVRVRGGRQLVTDGPFSETKEWIAGYDILECSSMDEAIAIAARHPMARFGRIEVRAVWPFEADG